MEPPSDKDERKKHREEKKLKSERLKAVKRDVKMLEKLELEAAEKRAAAISLAEREIALARTAAADVLRICSDPDLAKRYFTITDRTEIVQNEFNLNLSRYVDTFEPEAEITISDAVKAFDDASRASLLLRRQLRRLLTENGAHV
jgi:type I restriction enzyme M protein